MSVYARISPSLLLSVMLLLCVAQVVRAQAGSATAAASEEAHKITFDVISVKPNNSSDPTAGMRFDQNAFTATNIDVHQLLLQAFHLSETQLLSEPKWTKTEHWDIAAKMGVEDLGAARELTFTQRLDMFQQILHQRFGLEAHHETREMPVYALVIAKGGPKLKESKAEAEGIQGARRAERRPG